MQISTIVLACAAGVLGICLIIQCVAKGKKVKVSKTTNQ